MKKYPGGIIILFSLTVTFVALGILFLLSSTSITGRKTASIDYYRSQMINNIESGFNLIDNNKLPEWGDDNIINIETIESGTIILKRQEMNTANFTGQYTWAGIGPANRTKLNHIKQLSNNFTISFWIYPSNVVINDIDLPSNGEPIIGFSQEQNEGFPGAGFIFYYSKNANIGSLNFTVAFESGSETISIDNITDKVWMFVAVTYDGNTLKIFKDGEQQEAVNVNSSINWAGINDAGFYIGRKNNSNQFNSFWFSGYIRNVGIWSSSMSNQTIAILNEQGLAFSPLVDFRDYSYSMDLHLYFKLNDGTGNYINDLSIYNNRGTIINRNNEAWTTLQGRYNYSVGTSYVENSRSRTIY